MRNQKPPFEITNQMIDYVAEIAELMGKLSAAQQSDQNHPWVSGHRAEYPFLRAGNCCFEW